MTRLDLRRWLTVIGLILCFCLFDVLHNYVGLVGQGRPVPWRYLVLGVPEFWVTYFAVLPLAVFLARRYRLDLLSRRSLLVHVGGAFAFTYIHIVIVAASPVIRLQPDVTFSTQLFRVVMGNFSIDFLSYWAIVGATYMTRYYAELQQREVAAAQLEASLAQARLQALQAQLRPHFFFNTLQAISVLALKGDKAAVVETLAHLSNLLRVTFDRHQTQKIPLAAELEFVDEYLAIERLSLGDRLTVVREIDPRALAALVPSMVVQLLVENAIVHGVASRAGRGTVAISACAGENTLRLQIRDSGPGFPDRARNGIGLANTLARLEQLYGSAHRIDFGSSAEGGASVTITLPFEPMAAAEGLRPREVLAS
jgi:two-component system LytT family sensor kinase